MTDAPPRWQEECTQTLLSSLRASGVPGRTQWEHFRERADRENKRILIADADLSGHDLRGFDLSRCWIGRTSFVSANLAGVIFVQSIFRECDATDANIEGTNFRDADLRGDGLSLKTRRYDDLTIMEVARDRLPDEIDRGLLVAAERARRARLWRHRKSQSMVVQGLLWITGYGFSLHRLAIVGLIIIVLFAAAFWWLGAGVGAALLASTSYFISLDATFSTHPQAILGVAEAVIGMIFFAVLTTILVSLFFDKN